MNEKRLEDLADGKELIVVGVIKIVVDRIYVTTPIIFNYFTLNPPSLPLR